jgi:hypothetical protein
MATAPLAWLRSITSVSTVGYTRHWALWTVAATERGLVILESGGRQAAARQPPGSRRPATETCRTSSSVDAYGRRLAVTSQPTRFPFLLTSQDCKRRSTSVFHVMPSACMKFDVFCLRQDPLPCSSLAKGKGRRA